MSALPQSLKVDVKSSVKTFLGGFSGLIGTLGLLMLINSSLMDLGRTEKMERVVKFEIKKQQQTKKLSQIKKKKKPKKTNKLKPDLRSMVAGMSFGIPSFEMDFGSGSDFLNQGGYMNGAKVDQKPTVVYRAELEFPSEALDSNKSGYVTFGVFIDENGELKKVDVLDSHPKGIFEQAATASIKRWKFKPAVHKGINVATWQEQRIVFDAEAS
jgi:protein TonB